MLFVFPTPANPLIGPSLDTSIKSLFIKDIPLCLLLLFFACGPETEHIVRLKIELKTCKTLQ